MLIHSANQKLVWTPKTPATTKVIKAKTKEKKKDNAYTLVKPNVIRSAHYSKITIG